MKCKATRECTAPPDKTQIYPFPATSSLAKEKKFIKTTEKKRYFYE